MKKNLKWMLLLVLLAALIAGAYLLYDSLKEICEKLLRYDDSCSDEESAFYDDYYYYIFNDDELSVSRYSLNEDCDTEWF